MPSSVPSNPMSTIQSSMSSGAGIQASSSMISSTPNETGALATRIAGLDMGPPGLGFDQGLMTILTASPERIRAIPATVSSSGIVAVIIGARFSRPLSTSRMAAGKVKFEM